MRSSTSRFNGVSRPYRHIYSVVLLGLVFLCTNSTGAGSSLSSATFTSMASGTGPYYAALIQSTTAGCTTSKPSSGAYSVTVCFTSPSSDATLTGNATVTASVNTTGISVQRVLYYLDGAYLLTDYSSAYTFLLPTKKWVDGTHSLSASATMRDGFVSARTSRSVTFKNGIAGPTPVADNFTPTSGRAAASGTAFVVAASGDGASGETYAARVSNMLKAMNPNLFLYLGDVYEQGTVSEFFNWYGNTGSFFSALRSITDPTVGNHEYLTSGASGYFDYWNNPPKYYSFNANGWHFVSLDSNSSYVPTAVGSPQYTWLQSDLAALSPNTCTIVYYHHPLFNIGPEGAGTQMAAIWSLMAKDGVDIVINGHDHDYQRWKPLDANGNIGSSGITEFVAGGAGHGLQTLTRSDSRVAYKNDTNPTAFGVLALTLQPTKAVFKYQNTSGIVLDYGTIPCGPSSAGATPTFTPVADAYVDASNPTANFGISTVLRADASPDQHSYLRFTVSGLGGLPVQRAQLMLFANSNALAGITVKSVASNTWGETSVNYSTMPALGGIVATVSTAAAGMWITLDVTSYVKAEGTYSFGVVTSSSTSVSLASRESGTNAPKLLITLGP